MCELKLPEGLEEIGEQIFLECSGFHGELKLPNHLKKIGAGAFKNCKNLSGNLVIPQSLTTIPAGAFNGCWFGGNLVLHDGITAIGSNALPTMASKVNFPYQKIYELFRLSVSTITNSLVS